MLIVFEGIDGSGKTALSKRVQKHLKDLGKKVVWFREPTDMQWGAKIRAVFESGERLSPKEEVELFMKDRKDDVEKRIIPALNEGKIVLLDRYYFSTAAYQGAEGLDWMKIIQDNEKFAVRPHIIFFLLTHPEVALRRIEKEGRKKTAPEKLEVMQRIDNVYRQMFSKLHNDGYNIKTINTFNPLDDLEKKVTKLILRFLKLLHNNPM